MDAAFWLQAFWSDVNEKPRIIFLVRSFDRGGAERQLAALLLGLCREGWPVSVACFYTGGALQHDLEAAGVPIFNLGKKGRWDVFGFTWRLVSLIKAKRPDILHSYLPLANVLASVVRLWVPSIKVVWGVRNCNVDVRRYNYLKRISFWMERHATGLTHLIIANSYAGTSQCVVTGFPATKLRTIPNGIDTQQFRFDTAGRSSVRRKWRIPDAARLVGVVGRLDPEKGHPTFLEAAAILSRRNPQWSFVCVGCGTESYTNELQLKSKALGLSGRLLWAGTYDHMAAVYSAIDIVVLASFGEGFPNAVAEAMACGCPCVVTDVGDSAVIVGDFGVVVPPLEPVRLAAGIEQMQARLEREGAALRSKLRERIETQFSIAKLLNRTASVLQNVATQRS